MDEENKGNLWEQLLKEFEENEDIGDFVKGLEGEKPPSTSNIDTTQEQTNTGSSTTEMVTIEFYEDTTADKLYSFAYETRYRSEVQPHIPKGVSIVWSGGGDFPNAPPLEDFVKEYIGQLEHRGFRPEDPQKIDMDHLFTGKLLFTHEYAINSKGRAQTGLMMGDELTGILKYLQERYK